MKTLTIYFKVLMLVKCLDCGGLGFLFLQESHQLLNMGNNLASVQLKSS